MKKVYILKDDKNIVKIGFTSVAAESRRALCSHHMCRDFSVVAYFDNPKTSARPLERMIHNLCSNYRVALKDCNGNNCYEYYNMPDEVLAFAILYLAEATANKLDYDEFASSIPFKSDIKKVLKGVKIINMAIAEGFVLHSGTQGNSDRASDGKLSTEIARGRGWEDVRSNDVSNRLVMRFNSQNCRAFRFTKSEQTEMPRFASVEA